MSIKFKSHFLVHKGLERKGKILKEKKPFSYFFFLAQLDKF